MEPRLVEFPKILPEESQLAYEDALGKAQKLQADLEEKEVNLGKAITDRKADKTDEEKAKADNEKDLQAEKDYKKETTPAGTGGQAGTGFVPPQPRVSSRNFEQPVSPTEAHVFF